MPGKHSAPAPAPVAAPRSECTVQIYADKHGNNMSGRSTLTALPGIKGLSLQVRKFGEVFSSHAPSCMHTGPQHKVQGAGCSGRPLAGYACKGGDDLPDGAGNQEPPSSGTPICTCRSSCGSSCRTPTWRWCCSSGPTSFSGLPTDACRRP